MTPDASPPADRLTEQEKAANRRRWWGLTDPAGVQRPEPLADFTGQVAKFNEVMAMSGDEAERLAAKVRSLSVEALTEAELAACERMAATVPATAMPTHWDLAMHWVPRLIADLRAIRAEAERLRRALDFYANPEHWEAKFVGMAGSTEPNPGASVWESGPANDGGERARRALNVHLP